MHSSIVTFLLTICSHVYKQKKMVQQLKLFAILVFVVMLAGLGVEGRTVQFRSNNAPNMCAAGKSNWSNAIGSGPCKLEFCYYFSNQLTDLNFTSASPKM